MTTSSAPIFTPPTSTTVSTGRNSRLASLNGLVICMISWIPPRWENASLYAYALPPMTPTSVRSSPREISDLPARELERLGDLHDLVDPAEVGERFLVRVRVAPDDPDERPLLAARDLRSPGSRA